MTSPSLQDENCKHKDLLVIREIEYKGIKVLVEINTMAQTASLVEVKNDGSNGLEVDFTGKKWVFVNRTIPYLKTWIVIFEAMGIAIQYAIGELEKVEEEKTLGFVELTEKAMTHTIKALHEKHQIKNNETA